MNLRRTKSAKISNNFQQFKEEVREELQEKSAEILELKEKLEDVEQQCYDIVSKNDFRGQDGQMSFESLKQWVTLSLDGVNTQMDELKDIVSLVTGNFTSETYRGDLKLHYELLERFHDVTYQLGDLNSRVDNLQEHLISLGSSDNVNGTTVTTLKGEPGMPGTAGLPGYDGLPGPKGDSGRPGEKGDQGLPGLDGPKGDKGEPGDLAGCNKLESCKGEKGAVGPQGRLGRRGFRGPKGDRGEKGIMAVSVQDLRENDIDFLIGEPGYPGRPGQPGQRGSKGNKGDKGSATAAGFLLTRHSQSSVAPDCLATMTKLWVGYSLLSLGGRTSSTQDLGGAGSCILSFKVLALQSCSGDKCKQGDTSHWLSTMPRGDESARASGRKAEKLVSRCVVCEVPSNAIAVHSQGALIPDCPSGWTSVWTGYSFLKVSSMSAGQDLSSPGSCLEEFSHQPVTKCTDGTCFYDKDDNGVWLSAKMNKENAPSRCSVCINT